jgi:hypothetical protein
MGLHQGKETKAQCGRKSKWDKYRPDILMIAGTNKRPIKRREADVVETKYCRDTDPTMQQSRAENEHDAAATTETHRSVGLMQSLRDAGYKPDKVRLHVILLGVGGTLYTTMHTTMKQLGMKRQATVLLWLESSTNMLRCMPDESCKPNGAKSSLLNEIRGKNKLD